ncbi:MAG: type II toxin-antitoxin system VapC family toxin [Chloroflexi bacterium]|nr:type II toxin-antitoxin system VapC family toxin [Chloroflexota bacterium]
MIYWDASAIVPLLIRQASSPEIEGILKGDPMIVTWWATSIESVSALCRVTREGILTRRQSEDAMAALDTYRVSWQEIAPSGSVRDRAIRLLFRYPLRAADAAQLAAASEWANGTPRGHRLLTLDSRLAEAARGEGFEVISVGRQG